MSQTNTGANNYEPNIPVTNIETEDVYTDNTGLIHRLNRAQGQIEAIKKSLAAGEEKDCQKTLNLLKAANNALKKFGEAYVSQYVTECMHKSQEHKTPEEMDTMLRDIITSAFKL